MQIVPMRNRVSILLAPLFNEKSVVYCLSQMRAQSFSVDLVSLDYGLISSFHGLNVRPDISLSQLLQSVDSLQQHLLILPGRRACMNKLFSDPRVHQLIDVVLNSNGFVALLSSVSSSPFDAKFSSSEAALRLLTQGSQETSSFVQILINRLSV